MKFGIEDHRVSSSSSYEFHKNWHR